MECPFRIHWFSFTVHNYPEFHAFYDEFFSDKLGPIERKPHGGRGYRELWVNAAGSVTVYVDPVNPGECHFHIEIRGAGCDCLTPDDFRAVADFRRSLVLQSPGSGADMVYKAVGGLPLAGVQIVMKRLDVAWDEVSFSPQAFENAFIEDYVACKASRKSLQVHKSPFELREDLQVGTYTVSIGNNNSGRMVRVYNKRGPTRLELQTRHEWAEAYTWPMLDLPFREWYNLAMGYLRSFIEIKLPWWTEWVERSQPAIIRVYSMRHVCLDRAKKWLVRQVSGALVAVQTVEGALEFWDMIYQAATPKKMERWRPVMALAGA